MFFFCERGRSPDVVRAVVRVPAVLGKVCGVPRHRPERAHQRRLRPEPPQEAGTPVRRAFTLVGTARSVPLDPHPTIPTQRRRPVDHRGRDEALALVLLRPQLPVRHFALHAALFPRRLPARFRKLPARLLPHVHPLPQGERSRLGTQRTLTSVGLWIPGVSNAEL